MTYSVTLARALLDVAHDLPPDQQAHACEAALVLLRQRSPRSVAGFGRVVQQELRRRSSHVQVIVTTPTGTLGDRKDSFRRTLEDMAKKPVRFLEESGEELLGGAVVRMGDEHYDGSLQSALQRLESSLLQPL